MKETYEIGPGRVVTITVQVDDATSGLAGRLYTAEEVGDLQASEAELVAAPLRRQVDELRELVAFKDRVITGKDEDVEKLFGTVTELRSRLANGTADHVDRLARQVRELSNRVREYDRDRTTERDRADQNKAWAERAEANGVQLSAALVQAEKDRDVARRRVAELERALSSSIDREDKLEADAAEAAELHAQSMAARDRLLAAATTRVRHALELLTAPEVAEARENIVTSRGVVLETAIGAAVRVLDKA